MTQTWHDLLFAHWPVEAERLSPHIPGGLSLDVFAGQAWLGIVPFRMTNVAPRGVPAIPGLSAFAELNVRTYVRAHDKPGVFFFSLDAASRPAVWSARTCLGLPYELASMQVERRGSRIHYRSRRRRSSAAFVGTYQPRGPVFRAAPGSFAYFLTERYCLYGVHRLLGLYRLDIHHRPWPLQTAEIEVSVNTMAEPLGVVLRDPPPVLHFAARQDVVAWAPQRVS
jgi:uncharacterized protein YqjF (DUF2071 family)